MAAGAHVGVGLVAAAHPHQVPQLCDKADVPAPAHPHCHTAQQVPRQAIHLH